MSTPTGKSASAAGALKVPDLNSALATAAKSSSDSVHRVKNLPGYTTPVFKGKDEQRSKVQADLTGKVRIHPPYRAVADPSDG